MLSKYHPLVIWAQSLRVITEDERVKKVEETCPEHEKDEHSNHGKVYSVEILGVEDGYKQDTQLANGCTYNAYNGEHRLLL